MPSGTPDRIPDGRQIFSGCHRSPQMLGGTPTQRRGSRWPQLSHSFPNCPKPAKSATKKQPPRLLFLSHFCQRLPLLVLFVVPPHKTIPPPAARPFLLEPPCPRRVSDSCFVRLPGGHPRVPAFTHLCTHPSLSRQGTLAATHAPRSTVFYSPSKLTGSCGSLPNGVYQMRYRYTYLPSTRSAANSRPVFGSLW